MHRSTSLLISLLAFALFISPVLRAQNKNQEPTPKQRMYYFEHRLLPKWVFGSNGAFYEDLQSGHSEKLKAAAASVVGKEFADKLQVEVQPNKHEVLITFDPPKDMPMCYFILIDKTEAGFSFRTLELTEDTFNKGIKTMVCGWAADGSHQNFGPRKYIDAASFLAEPKDRSPAITTTIPAKKENQEPSATAK